MILMRAACCSPPLTKSLAAVTILSAALIISDKEDHILLDILFKAHSYPALLRLPVKTSWLVTDQQDIFVNVPSVASIAGDKLTAFAPTTTGILYGKGKEVEIVKQLHDINKLYPPDRINGHIPESF
jgi:hypothetical protein